MKTKLFVLVIMSFENLFEESLLKSWTECPSPCPSRPSSPLLLPLDCPTPPFHVDFKKYEVEEKVETINPCILNPIPKETIEMLYNQLIDDHFVCLCGIERKSKRGIQSHIKNVHFGQSKPKVQKAKKEKIQKKKVDNVKVNCYNCHKTFANKRGVLRHIKKQVCAKDSDTVMGF
jgi:hypothetical protein